MSKESNNLGRAYEYACIVQLAEKIGVFREVKIIENGSLWASKSAWDSVGVLYHERLIISASAAIETLIEVEPLILEDDGDILELRLQRDTEGEIGDVRDCVIIRRGIKWEIGLSIKHNHFAVKHSRLAKGLDFGERWFGLPCSKEYWDEVKPVFDYLEKKVVDKEKWKNIPNKTTNVYVPLLKAFLSEIRRSYDKDNLLPTKMVEYLLGCHDFYKVISIDNRKITQIQSYNLRGTLNKSGKNRKSNIIIPIVNLPTRIVSSEFKPNSNTTVELYFDEGWQFSFRIHNASTFVETSLKFDVQIKGMPTAIMALECKWE